MSSEARGGFNLFGGTSVALPTSSDPVPSLFGAGKSLFNNAAKLVFGGGAPTAPAVDEDEEETKKYKEMQTKIEEDKNKVRAKLQEQKGVTRILAINVKSMKIESMGIFGQPQPVVQAAPKEDPEEGEEGEEGENEPCYDVRESSDRKIIGGFVYIEVIQNPNFPDSAPMVYLYHRSVTGISHFNAMIVPSKSKQVRCEEFNKFKLKTLVF
jgi:hypothetical protein